MVTFYLIWDDICLQLLHRWGLFKITRAQICGFMMGSQRFISSMYTAWDACVTFFNRHLQYHCNAVNVYLTWQCARKNYLPVVDTVCVKTYVMYVSYSVKVKRELEIPALLTDGFPVCLLHQLVVQVDWCHCLIYSHKHPSLSASLGFGLTNAK